VYKSFKHLVAIICSKPWILDPLPLKEAQIHFCCFRRENPNCWSVHHKTGAKLIATLPYATEGFRLGAFRDLSYNEKFKIHRAWGRDWTGGTTTL